MATMFTRYTLESLRSMAEEEVDKHNASQDEAVFVICVGPSGDTELAVFFPSTDPKQRTLGICEEVRVRL